MQLCPRLYVDDYPLLPDNQPPRLKTVTGQLIKTFGLRTITYHINDKYLTVNFVVCDVKIPVLSVSILADKGSHP